MISKKELYKLYVLDNLSSIQISEIKNIGRTTVLNYLTKYNIPKKPTGSQVKYNANHNYFDKWSINMAYCLGFIAADGHVWENRPFFTIGIHKKDIELLRFIRDNISPMSNVRLSKDKCQLCIFSKQIHKKLRHLGIDYNKTFHLKLPKNIPKKYISHFIRGFFDGDGSIWKTKFYQDGRDYYYANIVSGSEQILKDIQKFLGFGTINKIKNKYYEIKFSQSQCVKLKIIMYKNATFRLERKYQKFVNINSTYKLWSKKEDDIILNKIDERNTKQLIPMLPHRTPKTIQTRKNYLRKQKNEITKNY
jgi:intein/homing endonuclease